MSRLAITSPLAVQSGSSAETSAAVGKDDEVQWKSSGWCHELSFSRVAQMFESAVTASGISLFVPKCSWFLFSSARLNCSEMMALARERTPQPELLSARCIVSFHLPVNFTLEGKYQQTHLQSSHRHCYPSKPNKDKLEVQGE